jgi:hypothetical protein
MLAVVGVAILLAVGAARLGAAVVASARADSAADAAALAAADMLALGRGAGAAEVAAGDTASANGARIVHCDCGGRFATVTVEIDVGVLGAVAEGVARAEVRGTALP